MKTPILFALALLWSAGLLAQEPARQNDVTSKATEVPPTIDFQGRLHDSGGSPVNATLSITFSLYNVLSGGTALWTETRSVQVTDGLFQVKLGEITPFNASHFSGTDRWLGIQVGTEAEMSPRTKFSSVGYAMQALETDPSWNGNADQSSDIGRTGRVGIGLTSPTQTLDVNGAIRLRNHLFDYNNTSGSNGQVLTRSASGVLWQSIPASPWIPSGPNIYYNTGNVGIGTSSPVTKLEVIGASRLDNHAIGGNYVELNEYGTGNRVSLVDFHGDDTYTDFGLRIIRDNTGANANSIIQHRGTGLLQIYNQESAPITFCTSTIERMRISPEGFVGIGTSNPFYHLDVHGTGRFRGSGSGIGIIPGESSALIAFFSTGGSRNRILFDWDETQIFGRVGIGLSSTSDYLVDLHVNQRIRIGEDPMYPSVYGELIRQNQGDGQGFRINSCAGGGWADLHLQTDGATRVFIESAGNVGVGTMVPRYTLDVNGNIRAVGSVYYGGSASTDGTPYIKPDFVFNDDYASWSIEETESFLARNKHLPWVTSAEQEKEENGEAVDMTRMAFETLESVENLQLQIIEQQKIINELLKRIEALENEE